MRNFTRLLTICLMLGLGSAMAATNEPPSFAACKALGPGVNLGNMFEAPTEGDWGYCVKDEYLTTIAAAGFKHIRLPVRWSAYAAETAPYTIKPTMFERIDQILNQAEAAGLKVVLDIHHYDEFYPNPKAHHERLIGLWQQIATHYQDRSSNLYFEVLNEPTDKVNPHIWDTIFNDCLVTIRRTNPARPVVVGPVNWNNIHAVPLLQLPPDDNLIVTFHYYDPFNFTHQGAEWQSPPPPVGIAWNGTDADKQKLADDFAKAVDWAKTNHRPLYLGEFGAYNKADLASRAKWTKAIRDVATKHQITWCYWEFCAGFGVYDPSSNNWIEPLRQALLD
jgi:endoglucanase